MAIDPVFAAVPEGPTFQVWRIENFKPVAWAEPGAFFTGDSYIVLSAVLVGSSQRVSRDIYFWIGSKSTQDEYGTAAVKTVELDDRFKGEPTQHREVQGHESEAFVKLFDTYGGVRYYDGGVASGFKAIPAATGTTLFQIKGQKAPVLQIVPPTGASLNQGDVFIAASDKTLIIWIGTGANLKEKLKASQVAETLRAKYKAATVTRLENGETSPELWALLGGQVAIASAAAGGADDAHEVANVRKIFQVDGAAFKLIGEGAAATKDKLAAGVYVIQRGDVVLVYFGKGVPADVKKTGIQKGLDFLAAEKLPNYYEIAVVSDGSNSTTFDVVFA
jgi:hypothetical protein